MGQGPPRPSLPLTFSPFALLMARRGLSTLSTRRIFTTEMVLDLRRKAELRWGNSPPRPAWHSPAGQPGTRLGPGAKGKGWQRHADVTKSSPHTRPGDTGSWRKQLQVEFLARSSPLTLK